VPVAPPAPTKRAPDHLLGGCADAAGAPCAAWVASGECDANPAFMLESCRKSCGGCGEKRAPRLATGTLREELGDEELGDGSVSSGFARLDSGALMPLVGFGTAGLGEATERAVLWALEAGYRSIDSAQAREWYREDLVGNAVARSGVAREALFLTSKLHPRHLGYDATTRQFQASLDDLRVDYLDLFLLHYPRCWGSLCDSEPEGTWQDSWRALEALHAAGKARAIGVSNFDAGELRELARVATVQPAVVQRNSDVFAADLGVRVFCTARGWQYEAYSSLGTQWLMKGHRTNPVLTAPAVVAVAERRGVSPAAVALRWALDKGQVVIPRSSNRERIEENLRVLDMPQLTESEMDELDKLDGHPPFVTF
jgi:diketogulonate reductase-like aldo/keto reductase